MKLNLLVVGWFQSPVPYFWVYKYPQTFADDSVNKKKDLKNPVSHKSLSLNQEFQLVLLDYLMEEAGVQEQVWVPWYGISMSTFTLFPSKPCCSMMNHSPQAGIFSRNMALLCFFWLSFLEIVLESTGKTVRELITAGNSSLAAKVQDLHTIFASAATCT